MLAGTLHPLQEADIARLQTCCHQAVNWQSFAVLVERHGLIPTTYRNLSTHAAGLVPQPVLAGLREQAERNRQRILQLLGELNRISGWFAQAGIPLCALKGPLLAQRLFGDVALRSSTDLDLLVHPAALGQAEALLFAHGYQRVFPAVALTPRQWQAFQQEWYHYSYVLRGPRVFIEIHWTIAPPELCAPEAVHQMLMRARSLSQSGSRLAALADEDLPTYLLIHGSKHNWVRLKWLVDFAVWMRGAGPLEWQALEVRMGELGLQRVLGQGVLLANQLFEIPLPEALSPAVTQNLKVQRLAEQSTEEILDPSYRGTEFGRQQRLHFILYAMRLKHGWRYKWDTFRNLWMVPYDWQDVPLPDSLFPLYGLLRPLLWLRRWLRHRRQSHTAALPPGAPEAEPRSEAATSQSNQKAR